MRIARFYLYAESVQSTGIRDNEMHMKERKQTLYISRKDTVASSNRR